MHAWNCRHCTMPNLSTLAACVLCGQRKAEAPPAKGGCPLPGLLQQDLARVGMRHGVGSDRRYTTLLTTIQFAFGLARAGHVALGAQTIERMAVIVAEYLDQNHLARACAETLELASMEYQRLYEARVRLATGRMQ